MQRALLSALKGLVICAVVVTHTACSTMALVEPQQQTYASTLEIGDKVHIHTRSGTDYELTISGVNPSAIVGVDSRGKARSINLTDIRSIEVERFSPGKTILAVLATAAVAAVLLAIYGATHYEARCDEYCQ